MEQYRKDGQPYTSRRERLAFERHIPQAPIYFAGVKGEWDKINKRPRRNPYPKGKRHAAYERGYDLMEYGSML